MTARPDDDALSWGDEDDPTLHVGETAADDPEPEAPELPEGFTAVGKGAETVRVADAETAASVAHEADEDEEESPVLGSVGLVSVGVLGGIYLLYTIGWAISGTRLRGVGRYLVADVMSSASLWLAVAAPVLWFGTTWYATRTRPVWQRFAWLAAGAVLLVPWPLLMVGGAR